MSCARAPKKSFGERIIARGGRLIAMVAMTCLAAGPMTGCAATEAELEPTTQGAMAGGEVPGQAGTRMGESDKAFTRARARFVKKMNRKLAQIDEQIEQLDAMLVQQRDPEMPAGSTAKADQARAQLGELRTNAQTLVERAGTASLTHWIATKWQAAEAVDAVDENYYVAANTLYQ